jgi:peroxiredoxin
MSLLSSKQTLKQGDRAPDFKLLGIDDKQHTLLELKGEKATLIIFMCNHCPFVIPKFDMMRELYKEFKEKGVEIIGINPNDHPSYPEDNLDAMKEIHAQKELGFHYLIDSSQEVARSFDAVCTPDPFLFDKDLTLIWHGRLNDAMFPDDIVNEETMKEVIVEYLNTGKVMKEFKPSQGCSIKWR